MQWSPSPTKSECVWWGAGSIKSLVFLRLRVGATLHQQTDDLTDDFGLTFHSSVMQCDVLWSIIRRSPFQFHSIWSCSGEGRWCWSRCRRRAERRGARGAPKRIAEEAVAARLASSRSVPRCSSSSRSRSWSPPSIATEGHLLHLASAAVVCPAKAHASSGCTLQLRARDAVVLEQYVFAMKPFESYSNGHMILRSLCLNVFRKFRKYARALSSATFVDAKCVKQIHDLSQVSLVR